MYISSDWEVGDIRTWKKGSLAAASRRIRTSGAEVYCSRHVPSNFIRSIGRPMLYASTLTYNHNLEPTWNQTEAPFLRKIVLAKAEELLFMNRIEREWEIKQTRASSMTQRWSDDATSPLWVSWTATRRSFFLVSNP